MPTHTHCWMLLAATSLSARTAETLDFQAQSAVTTGVEAQRDGDFTLYRHLQSARMNSTPGLSADSTRSVETRPAPPAAPMSDCATVSNASMISGLKNEAVRRRLTWWPEVARAECRYGLPPGLLDALVLAESGYDQMAISSAGARGLTQLMPSTAIDLGVRVSDDPATNIDGGARYLRAMLARFGSVALGLAAYNAGPAAVSRANGIPANGETPAYVRRVFGYWARGRDPVQQLRQTAQLLGFTAFNRE